MQSFTFIIIPGAGGSAWYWHLVAPKLEEYGHKVVPVKLPASSALIQATIASYPNRESEEPSSLLRRRCAVSLPEELGVSKNISALGN